MMKNFLYSILTLLLILFLIIALNPILGKFISGTARVIREETRSSVSINGVKNQDAKVFISKSNFTKTEKRDYLILYLRDLENYKGFSILMIDRANHLVYIPNSTTSDYNLILGYLFQSDSGANVMVSIPNKTKGLGFEPKLKISNKIISFEIIFENKIQKILIEIH